VRQRFITLLVVLLLLISTVTACGPKKKEPAQPEPTATTQPAAQADPTATAIVEDDAEQGDKETDSPSDSEADTETEEQDDDASQADADDDDDQGTPLSSSDLIDPRELDSFRQTINWSSHDPEEGYLTGEMLMEWSRKDQATRTVLNVGGDAGEEMLSEIIQIGDTTYMQVGEEWMTMQSPDQEAANDMVIGWSDPSELIDECKSKGRDTINGMACKHYLCDKDVFMRIGILGMGSGEGDPLDGMTVEEGSYEFWISTKHNIPVKTIWQWKGTHEDGDLYDWYFESEITDINKPITIEEPAEAEEAGLPDDIPLMEGATEVGMFGDIVSFVAGAPQDEVIAYYLEEMPKKGWAQESTPILSMMTFAKDGRTATVIVGDEDPPSVTIMVNEE